MTVPAESVRGAARPRGGATDTTMLIWKVIEANPGIDRAGIWARVEHGIPEGYALRRLRGHEASRGRYTRDDSLVYLLRARNYVLSHALSYMRKCHLITWEGDGQDRRYTAAKQPRYVGNPGTIDETGTKGADHMAVADALRTAESLLARNPHREHGPALMGTRKEKEAVALVVAALRATLLSAS